MKNSDLAKLLLEQPDNEIVASVDIPTGINDSNGEQIIAKLFGYSVCGAFHNRGTTVIQFEESGSGGDKESVDVVNVVKVAQKSKSEKLNNDIS